MKYLKIFNKSPYARIMESIDFNDEDVSDGDSIISGNAVKYLKCWSRMKNDAECLQDEDYFNALCERNALRLDAFVERDIHNYEGMPEINSCMYRKRTHHYGIWCTGREKVSEQEICEFKRTLYENTGCVANDNIAEDDTCFFSVDLRMCELYGYI